MKRQTFKYYYLANTLIASAYTVKLYNRNDEFICNQFDDYYMEHKEELYNKDIYYISVKDEKIIKVMFID